jgi:hypothetical protein
VLRKCKATMQAGTYRVGGARGRWPSSGYTELLCREPPAPTHPLLSLRHFVCLLASLARGCAFSRAWNSFPALPLPLTLLRSRPFMKNLLLLSTVHESFVSPLLSPSLLRAPVATRRPVPHQRPAPLPPTSHFWRPAVKQIWGSGLRPQGLARAVDVYVRFGH